jgi:DNA-binding transcriptional regulator YhcF (GntR family)
VTELPELPALVIRGDDPVPPFEQLRRQLADLIRARQLPPGQRLPPVRQLAGDLRLAPGTVARAYRELEGEGFVVSRRGAGTRVADRPATLSPAQRRAGLAGLAERYVDEAQRLGHPPAEIAAAVAAALDRPRSR